MAKRAAKKSKKYVGKGKYIAFNPSTSKRVIASGSNPATVIKRARSQGVEIPAIVFVPEKDTTCLY